MSDTGEFLPLLFPSIIDDFFKRSMVRIVRLLVRSSAPATRLLPSRVRTILVVRQHDQLGDMLCAVPLLRALREFFPAASITLIASPVNHAIMLHHPFVDEIINYDKSRLLKSLRMLLSSFRRRKFDLALVPSTVSISFTSNLMALLSGARCRVGPKSLNGTPNPSSYCFTEALDLDWRNEPRRHQARRNLDLLRTLEISTANLQSTIGITAHEEKEAREVLAPMRKRFRTLVGIHPGAGKPPNRWDAEHFARLANRMSTELSVGIVITSGPMDAEPVTRMIAALQCEHLMISGQPIRKVAAIIASLDLYITNDTGTMHIAGATPASVLALFGPTDPQEWAPVGSRNHFIASKDGTVSSISEDEVFAMASLIIHGLNRQ